MTQESATELLKQENAIGVVLLRHAMEENNSTFTNPLR